MQKQIEARRMRQPNEGDAEQRLEAHCKGREAVPCHEKVATDSDVERHSHCAVEERSTLELRKQLMPRVKLTCQLQPKTQSF